MAAAIGALDGGTAEVYALVGVPPTMPQAVAAAVYAAGPMAWASYATAGVLWGMPGVEPTSIEILTPPKRKVGLSGVRGHRSAALFSKDLTTLKRIPVTAPERTLVDLSTRYDDGALGRILDDALRRRVIRLDRLRACTGRLAGAPGRSPAAIQALLSERLPGYDPGDSDLETRVLRLLIASGFSPPVQQHRLRVGGRSIRMTSRTPRSCWPSSSMAGSNTGPERRSTTNGPGPTSLSPTAGRWCASPPVPLTTKSSGASGQRGSGLVNPARHSGLDLPNA